MPAIVIPASYDMSLIKTICNIIVFALCLTPSLYSFASEITSFNTYAKQAVLLDFSTGQILFEKAANEKMTPSSMSKLMTIYVLLKEIENGGASLETEFTVSQAAYEIGGSSMFLEINSKVKIDDLLHGIIVHSGNDACITIAENLFEGGIPAFVDKMNETALQLGLSGSHFTNPTGLYDAEHYMTALDITKLSSAIIKDFPQYYKYFSQKEFTYNNITQPNRNLLLNDVIDGLKTGFTEEGGYGITVSGSKDKTDENRLILVINGLPTSNARIYEAKKLFEYGVESFEKRKIASKNVRIASLKLLKGYSSAVDLISKEDINILLPKSTKRETIRIYVDTFDKLMAPISTEEPIALLKIAIDDQEFAAFPLFANSAFSKAFWEF